MITEYSSTIITSSIMVKHCRWSVLKYYKAIVKVYCSTIISSIICKHCSRRTFKWYIAMIIKVYSSTTISKWVCSCIIRYNIAAKCYNRVSCKCNMWIIRWVNNATITIGCVAMEYYFTVSSKYDIRVDFRINSTTSSFITIKCSHRVFVKYNIRIISQENYSITKISNI